MNSRSFNKTAVALIVFSFLVLMGYSQDYTGIVPKQTTTVKPFTRWWWMGSAVDTLNLKTEFNRLAQCGYRWGRNCPHIRGKR